MSSSSSNKQVETLLLTGASSGIGRAIALRIATPERQLLMIGRNLAELEETQRQVKAQGGSAICLVAALDVAADRQRVLEYCRQLPGGLQGLINNAGVMEFALLEDQSEESVQRQIQVNLLAPIELVRLLLPMLRQSAVDGSSVHIINIGSTFGSIGYPAFSVYCASKFGLRGFTEALERELAATDIAVHWLAPRATRTAINPPALVAMNTELGNVVDAPEVVAAAVAQLLASPKSVRRFLGWPELFFARLNQLLPGVVGAALRKQLPVIEHHATLHRRQSTPPATASPTKLRHD